MSQAEAAGDRVRARWCTVAGILAENLALHLANRAMSWANSARRKRLGHYNLEVERF